MAKPSKGTPADKRLKENKAQPMPTKKAASKSSAPFGGKKANPFTSGGKRGR